MVFITHTQTGITGITPKSWIFLILSGLATGASWILSFTLGLAFQIVGQVADTALPRGQIAPGKVLVQPGRGYADFTVSFAPLDVDIDEKQENLNTLVEALHKLGESELAQKRPAAPL
mgnify:CR=1 FL=1